MKQIKKIMSLLLAVVMVFALAITASATGTLTIKGAKDGETYDLYKVLDLTFTAGTGEGDNKTPDKYTYKVNAAFAGYFTDNKIDDPVQHIAGLNAEDVAKLSKSLFVWAVENNVAPVASAEATADGDLTVNDLADGYYLMNPRGAQDAKEPYTSLFSLDTLAGDKDTEIIMKATYPTVDKKIVGGSVTTDDKLNETSIGKDVTFEVTSKIPDLTGYKSYYFCFNDVLSKGLTFKEIESVTIGGVEYTEPVAAGNDTDPGYRYDTKTNADGTTNLYIQIVNFFKTVDGKTVANYKSGDAITIKYKATLNKDAVINGANENDVIIEYSNDPSKDNGGTPGKPVGPTGESGHKKTETYTTDLTILKVDENNNPLTGAEFTLTGDGVETVIVTEEKFEVDENGTYWKLKDGTYTTDDPTKDGMDQDLYESTTVKYKKIIDVKQVLTATEQKPVTVAVDANGKVTIAGLGAGDYTLTESKVPTGYNKIDDIAIKVTFDATSKTFTVKANGTALNDKHELTVQNQKGSELPSTGGIGTTIFYVVGSLLVVGAGVMLVTKKRMNGVK